MKVLDAGPAEQAGEGAQSKSLHGSPSGRHFYETENVIWAGFGLIGNTEKKVWADYEQLLRTVF